MELAAIMFVVALLLWIRGARARNLNDLVLGGVTLVAALWLPVFIIRSPDAFAFVGCELLIAAGITLLLSSRLEPLIPTDIVRGVAVACAALGCVMNLIA